MDTASISALAALAGSAVGGLTSLAASWLSLSRQERAQQRQADKGRRQEIYKSFIEEAARLYGNALVTDKAEVASLVNIYALVSRMRVMSAPAVAECADVVVRKIVDTYFEPNKTLRDIRPAIDDNHIDILRPFSEACRDDLR